MSNKKISLETIEKWVESKDWQIRRAAMNACQGRTDIPIEVIEKWLGDEDWQIRRAAMNACQGRTDIPIEVIERGIKDENWYVRQAAVNVCQGRTDIPIEVIERGIKDGDRDVRRAAMNACQGRTDIPLLRTIEPPKNVYKKCLGGVIVVAEIPQTAQVRGGFNRKCRANESIIVDILGDVEGEKIGISSYDKTTIYEIGDHIVIDNFDYSDAECSTGFHFFNTLEEAQNYEF